MSYWRRDRHFDAAISEPREALAAVHKAERSSSRSVILRPVLLETFRYQDGNVYEYEIYLKVFLAYSQIIDTLDSFIVHLFHQKLALSS